MRHLYQYYKTEEYQELLVLLKNKKMCGIVHLLSTLRPTGSKQWVKLLAKVSKYIYKCQNFGGLIGTPQPIPSGIADVMLSYVSIR